MPCYGQKTKKLPWALHAGAERPHSSFPKRPHRALREANISGFIDRHTQGRQVKLTCQGWEAVIAKTVHLRTFIGSTPPKGAVVLLWEGLSPLLTTEGAFLSPKT